LNAALAEHHRQTGQSVDHIVRAALADYLQVSHSTLFQVSNTSALVKGIYEGEMTIAHLREHGGFGLGTFEGIDGEMVALDGSFYQIRSDGRATTPADSAKTPFAVVTHFVPQKTVAEQQCGSFAELEARVAAQRSSENIFYTVRLDGQFDYIRTRAMCKTAESVPLVEAAARQPEFEFRKVRGTLVGFWSPKYTSALNVPGLHLHFIDQQRTGGGHLLEIEGRDLTLQISAENDLRLALPENADFLKADLTRDPTVDLQNAEKARPSTR
jgi:acetolactate decarboxylase